MKLRNKLNRCFVFGLSTFVFSSFLGANSPRYDFEGFYQFALSNSGVMKIAQAEFEKANSLEEEVLAKRTPRGELMALGSVVPEAVGDAVNGETNSNRWGHLFDISLKIYQPIFAFGASVSGMKGAKAGIEAKRQLLKKEEWQLRHEIAELYYAYQLSFELLSLADQFESKLQKAFEKNKRNKTRADQINIYLQQVKMKKLEALRKRDQIRSAMVWKTGLDSKKSARWDRANLKKREFSLKELDYYLEKVPQTRPDWKALELEQVARKNAYKAHHRMIWPQLFVGAKVEYAVSPVRENQESPFANDPYNKFSGAVGLGARWDLSFWEKSAKVSKARAEYLSSTAKEAHLKKGILLEVEKDYIETQRYLESYELSKNALKSSKNVMQDQLTAFEMNSSKIKDLQEALLLYAKTKKEHLELVYQLNLASVRLEKSLGFEL